MRPLRVHLFHLALLFVAACSPQEDAPVYRLAQPLTPKEAARHNGFTVVCCQYGPAFLAENPRTGKRILYLEGTHREMGFQVGYLCPEAVRTMVHDYCDEVLFEMLDLPIGSTDLGPLWDFVRSWLKDLVAASDHNIPLALIEEMQGIVSGYATAQSEGRTLSTESVDYCDVLLLNQGMDAISSLAYNSLGKAGLACNQFACWGDRTTDGRLYHGRDFQFYTAGVYQDVSLVAVYRPVDEDGRPSGFPFITVSSPGFVGQATALNSQGISMGIDVVHSWAALEGDPGISGLMLLRTVMETAATLEEAVSIVRDAYRGCPWIYLVADGKSRDAVVLETIQSTPPSPWMDGRLQEAEALGTCLTGMSLSWTYPDHGLMVRRPEFDLPHQYRDKSINVPGYRNNPKYPADSTLLNFNFSDTMEDLPDMIAVTNHFLLPEMRAFQWAPLVSLVWRAYWPSTEWRYRTLVELLLERSTGTMTLDWNTAWRTIDFLNPATEQGAFFHGPELDQQVGGHVALMDDQDLVLRALYGYYTHQWTEVHFRDFIP